MLWWFPLVLPVGCFVAPFYGGSYRCHYPQLPLSSSILSHLSQMESTPPVLLPCRSNPLSFLVAGSTIVVTKGLFGCNPDQNFLDQIFLVGYLDCVWLEPWLFSIWRELFGWVAGRQAYKIGRLGLPSELPGFNHRTSPSYPLSSLFFFSSLPLLILPLFNYFLVRKQIHVFFLQDVKLDLLLAYV